MRGWVGWGEGRHSGGGGGMGQGWSRVLCASYVSVRLLSAQKQASWADGRSGQHNKLLLVRVMG